MVGVHGGCYVSIYERYYLQSSKKELEEPSSIFLTSSSQYLSIFSIYFLSYFFLLLYASNHVIPFLYGSINLATVIKPPIVVGAPDAPCQCIIIAHDGSTTMVCNQPPRHLNFGGGNLRWHGTTDGGGSPGWLTCLMAG